MANEPGRIRHRRRLGFAGALVIVGALALPVLLNGCAPTVQHLPPRDNVSPYDVITTYCPPTGGGAGQWRELHFDPVLAVRPTQVYLRRFHPPLPDPPPEKIYPLLRVWQKDSLPRTRVQLLVTFRETMHLSRLPSLDEHQLRSNAVNLARLHQIHDAIGRIKAQRDSSYEADSTDLVNHFGATVLHRHWLTHSLLITMQLDKIDSLASRPSVIYIQPQVGIEAPPRCPAVGQPPDNLSAPDDPVKARQLIQSDAFRNLGLSYGYMSLLDTGVWTGHKIFNGVTFGVAGDCVHGGLDCQQSANAGFNPSDQCALSGHGTGSAAILVGGSSLGANWRGALGITLDYFQVFAGGVNCGGTCGLCLNADATQHAFEDALSNGDRVIVANIVSESPDRAAVAMAAINAYDLGAVVVAANGNRGEPTLDSSGNMIVPAVESPASAPCVIGVGSQDIRNLGPTESGQSRGPAWGNRIKPDIQAPTAVETAETRESGCTRTDLLLNLPGTSGATPYAGAAAALLRNWMKAGTNDVAPGNVYAAMILSGRHHDPNLNNTEGAGMIELPTDGCAWWSFAFAQPGMDWDVPINLTSVDADSIEAALWWPEYPAIAEDGTGVTRHNNVDLYLLDPNDAVKASSKQLGSVFERATAPITQKGIWKLRIEGANFTSGVTLQPVYWIVTARKKH